MGISGKFLGSTKGNRDLPCNRSTSGVDSPTSHSGMSGKFLGDTKGNRDLNIDRSSGHSSGKGGGSHKAGGK